jgi:hypothetical protein
MLIGAHWSLSVKTRLSHVGTTPQSMSFYFPLNGGVKDNFRCLFDLIPSHPLSEFGHPDASF